MRALRIDTSARAQRGTILILAMGITIVLTGLVLIFSRQMRVEALASGNMQSTLEADAIVDGAARHIINQLVNNTDPSTFDQTIQSQGVQLGGGQFWIVRPKTGDERQYDFGIVDESSKLNINTASEDMLLALPGMTQDLAASITDWRDPDPNGVDPTGAGNDYYLLLPEPYYAKNAPFESLEELLFVRGATRDVLFGVDANRNGVVDENESSGSSSMLSGINGQAQCGVSKYLTVYTVSPNVSQTGKARVFVGATNGQTMNALANLLNRVLPSGRSAGIIAKLRGGPAPKNVLDFYVKSGMSIDDFMAISDLITTDRTPTLLGKVNVNTAPREVLMCLPGLDSSDADLLISTRATLGSDQNNIAWVAKALAPAKAAQAGGAITTRSYQYSADIVAVAGNGRGFQRCKFVFDLRTTPPSIVMRKDITNLGWPLSADLLQAVKSGNAVSGTTVLNNMGPH